MGTPEHKNFQTDNETPASNAITYMGNLRKGQNELCRTDTDSHDFEKLMVSKGDRLGVGWGDALGVWDGNVIKLGCDDHCTTINIINSLSNIKQTSKKKNPRPILLL